MAEPKDSLQSGVEFGNADGFFSSPAINYCEMESRRSAVSRYEIHRAHLEWADSLVVNGGITRRVDFSPLSNSELYDMVSRFIIYSDDDRPACISGKVVNHRSSNIYHQYDVPVEVRVPIGQYGYVSFSSAGAVVPPGFKEVLYLRDEAKVSGRWRWIVHHRLICDEAVAKLVLRSCNPRLEGVIPLENYIPDFFKRPFFRIRERRWPSCPLMAVGEVKIGGDEYAALSTNIVFA